MNNVKFIGEWLWIGNLGHFFVVLMFITSLISTYFYYFAEKNKNDNYRNIARKSIYIHVFSVVSVFAILFAIIFYHRYEYYYAWRHSSNSLPVYYMISCFWEGQEGSFLLWLFWNSLIALVLVKKAGKWENSVMTIVSFTQIALGSMLLGLHFGEFKIGSSPFDLLREQRPDFLAIPVMESVGIQNYLQIFKDGNGLNKLLQNYWMVIHPPTLFLGFSLALVPFAYSIAGIWKKEDNSWLNPAMIWGLACTAILGTGIIMGGFWAYESLSFGGYWAWDPVENASLLPWLVMISAIHLMLISKNTNRHYFATHLLTQLSFILVLYATFLTRSGILGEASVHSFTDLGLSGQLLVFLLAFIVMISFVNIPKVKLRIQLSYIMALITVIVIVISYLLSQTKLDIFNSYLKWGGIVLVLSLIVNYIYNLYKANKSNLPDEALNSREFWMFLGSMFIILSLIQVISATSIPVFNKLFGSKTAVPQAKDYNNIQLWMALPIMILMAVGQYFTYRTSKYQSVLKDLVISFILSIGIGLLVSNYLISDYFGYKVFVICSLWLVFANWIYIIKYRRKHFQLWGASISHVGFGILLLGVILSSVNQKVLSSTDNGIALAPEQDEKGNLDEKGVKFNRENVILYKNTPLDLGKYEAFYYKREKGINYDSLDEFFYVKFIDKKTKDTFILSPKTQNNPKMGLLAEPSTKHYLSRDIFTHVNYESGLDKKEPFSGFKTEKVVVGGKYTTSSGKCEILPMMLEKVASNKGLALRMRVLVKRLDDTVTLFPQILINESTGSIESISASNEKLGIFLDLQSFNIEDPDPAKQKITFELQSAEKNPVKDYIVLKIIEFPWINLVWAGTIILLIGFIIAVIFRIKTQMALGNN